MLFQLQKQDVDINAGNKFRSIDTCQQQFCAILPRFVLKFYRRNVIKIQVSSGFFEVDELCHANLLGHGAIDRQATLCQL